MLIDGYTHFGGKHGESAALKNLLAFAGVVNPATREAFSEALCFGIAGGIGAGYSFCPSVPRYGCGSGVSAVGRHKIYATSATWYQDFFDRIGAKTRITETTGTGKAFQNLVAELEAGRPTVVWCSRGRLPFLGNPMDSGDLWMHTFVVYGIDEAKGLAYGADLSPTKVTLTLDELEAARNGICSHKNRTLTFDPPATLAKPVLEGAVRAGIRACVQELLQGKMKTYSLPGLQTWAKMMVNDANKDGWGKVFGDGLLYHALRDTFDSIETAGTGGGLYRLLYADFLDEAAGILGDERCVELARLYRQLAGEWTELAEAALPGKVKPFKQTRELLRKKRDLFETKGEKGAKAFPETVTKLETLAAETRRAFPLEASEAKALREELGARLAALHEAETAAAKQLKDLVA